jgi:DeoR family fructose operon transcriptional repressor
MLTKERHEEILKIVNNAGAVSVQELVSYLDISESTARRDLLTLDRAGKLQKVHGGATALTDLTVPYQADMEDLQDKYSLHMMEKREIGKYAASLIGKNDFVYIDAGSTTEQIAEFITSSEATFMTNSIPLVQKLARLGLTIFVIPGRVKGRTEAVVGSQATEALRQYHFTKGFFGTNGLSLQEGCTTPDLEESTIKSVALRQCDQRFVLADSSKFGLASHNSFAPLSEVEVITVEKKGMDYMPYKKVTEVHIL